MAFDPLPPSWMANWSEDATNITVPLATFTKLTAAEADASSGDIRKVLYAMCDHLWGIWNATAVADRPANMTITRGSQIDDTSPDDATRTFVFSFNTTISADEVTAE